MTITTRTVPGVTVAGVAAAVPAPPVNTDTARRLRLIEGMTAAVTERGFAATTIADIVRHARVSKRTFYEHFADKEECFLATYAHASDMLLQVIADAAADRSLPWEGRLDAAVGAYLSTLQELPALTRTMFAEILAAGAHALRLRREVLVRFAELIRDLVEQGRSHHPEVRALSPELAMVLVGGINELVLQAVEQDRVHSLTDLGPTAADVARAVLTAR